MNTISPFLKFYNISFKFLKEFTKFVSLFLLLIILFIVPYFIITEEIRNVVIIEPFDIPNYIVKKGYSGKTVAANLIDKLNFIKILTKTKPSDIQELPEFISKDINEGATIEVSGTGIPLTYLVEPIRKLFGKQRQCISGEIVILDLEKEKIRLQLRIIGKVSKAFDGVLSEFNNIVFEAAKYISEHIQPFVLAKYYIWYDWKPNRDYLYRDMLENENIKNKKDQKAKVFYYWGAHYLRQNRLEEADEKYKKSLDYEPAYLASRKGRGDVCQSAEKFKESISYYKEIINRYDDKYSEAYRRWGDALFAIKKHSEAIEKGGYPLRASTHYMLWSLSTSR